MNVFQLWFQMAKENRSTIATFAILILGFSTVGNAIAHDIAGTFTTLCLTIAAGVAKYGLLLNERSDAKAAEDAGLRKRFDEAMLEDRAEVEKWFNERNDGKKK